MAEIPLNIQSDFIRAATWHGELLEAEKLLQSYPGLSDCSIHIAAICGNRDLVSDFITKDAASVKTLAAPFGATALNYLGLSKYLRLKPELEKNFIDTAVLLLDHGADPNAGFMTEPPNPEFETVLYGAAGVAHNEALTRILLSRGANPDDAEVLYHSPEGYDLGAMKAVVETGKINSEGLALMLIRKHDFHDYYGVKYLLESGARPNTPWGKDHYPVFQALSRDNHIAIIRLLFDHHADPMLEMNGRSAISLAAQLGRADVLDLIRASGYEIDLAGKDALIAAAALGDEELANTIVHGQPHLKNEVLQAGGDLLARFSLSGNAKGIEQLLKLGIGVNTAFPEGDPYWSIPAGSLPIHIAAWRMRDEVMKVLIDNGAIPDQPDANGLTPLMLNVKACVDSYWTDMRSTIIAELLLKAGANPAQIKIPTGYPDMDDLIAKFI